MLDAVFSSGIGISAMLVQVMPMDIKALLKFQ
jgi:hypothetical protein